MGELTSRQLNIMRYVMAGFLERGDPIGSKAIMDALGGAFSSATIRSEMARMEGMGLLRQPHTSAGRVPTAMGIRYYIDNIMRVPVLSPGMRDTIDSMIVPFGPDPQAVVKKTGEALNCLTGCACIIVYPSMGMAKIGRIDLFFVRRGIWGVVITTSGGGIHSSVCRMDIRPEEGAQISKKMTAIFKDVMLRDISEEYIRRAMEYLGVYSFSCIGLLDAIQTFAHSRKSSSADVIGQSALARGRDPVQMENLLDFIGSEESIIKLFSPPQHLTVVLGEETPHSYFHDVGAVYTSYVQGEDMVGTIGALGSDRMDYSVVAAYVSYISELLGEILGGESHLERK